ncbi:MAG TPA: hypothetical protein VE779_02605 [Candidatus Angelobacter sp.]|nr:hypothetical protein [Candidatus Angelobacter sp.]
MTNDNELDALLHDALNEYRGAEPLAGMEERVLQRLALHSSQHRHRWLRWSLVAACTVALVVAVWIASRPGRPTADRVQQASAEPSVETPAKVAVEAPVAEAKAKQSIRRPTAHLGSATVAEGAPQIAASPAMPAQFPTPTPLTAQERAFMTAMQKVPDVMPGGSRADNEITIAKIEIKPLAIGGISSSENPGEKQ